MRLRYIYVLTTSFISLILLVNCESAGESVIPEDQTEPPFSGTIFLDPDIIVPDDPTAFVEIFAAGRGERTVFDRREDAWVTINVVLFNATFVDGFTVEMQVNPEFDGDQEALAVARNYAHVIGQLPASLREDVKSATVHKGTEPFGGGNENLLIHTGQSSEYESEGILEETLIHEATHTSLDAKFANLPQWIAAQETDNNFISTYARDFAQREDVAESFLLYFALRYRPDRISSALAETIQQTMPNRIAFFDDQEFEWFPQE